MVENPFLLFPVNEQHLQRQTGTPHYGQAGLNGGCMVLFLLPFLAVAVFLIGMLLNQLYEGVLLSINAIPTVAQVTDRRVSEDEGSYTYTLEYQYLVADRTYSGRQNVPNAVYETYQIGQDIPVTYAGNDGRISRITGVDTTSTNLFLVIFTVFWVSIVGCFSVIFFLAWRHSERLKRHGKLIYGEVIAFKGEKDTDGDYQITVKTKFRSPSNLQWVEGSRHYTCNHHLNTNPPAAGTPLAIFYADDKVWEVL